MTRYELIAETVPYRWLTPDYIVLAAMICHPDLIATHLPHIHPSHWVRTEDQIIARIALAHLQSFGRVDMRQLLDVLISAGTFSVTRLDIEQQTLQRIADCLAEWVVDRAVAELKRREAGAR